MESKEHSKPKLLFIGTDWGNNDYRKTNNAPGAISTYRLIYPKRYLPYDIEYVGSDLAKRIGDGEKGMIFYNFFSNYDMVVTKVVDNIVAASDIRFITQYIGIPLVVDIDDNIWEIKEDQPSYDLYRKGGNKLGAASTYISLADLVITSTFPLKEYIQNRIESIYKENKEVILLPNCVDTNDYNYSKASLDPNKIVIGWQGSITHENDLKIIMPALERIMKKYPQVEFEFLGGVTKESAMKLFKDFDMRLTDRFIMKPGVPAFDQFPKLLSEQAWDIAVAPLTDDVFNRCKSHIKWMEYAMYEIPCVASDVYPYTESIQGTKTIVEGKTGLLAKDDEWFEKLSYLIDNPEKRITLGKNAKKYVSDAWHIKNHAYKWKEVIDTVLKLGK